MPWPPAGPALPRVRARLAGLAGHAARCLGGRQAHCLQVLLAEEPDQNAVGHVIPRDPRHDRHLVCDRSGTRRCRRTHRSLTGGRLLLASRRLAGNPGLRGRRRHCGTDRRRRSDRGRLPGYLRRTRSRAACVRRTLGRGRAGVTARSGRGSGRRLRLASDSGLRRRGKHAGSRLSRRSRRRCTGRVVLRWRRRFGQRGRRGRGMPGSGRTAGLLAIGARLLAAPSAVAGRRGRREEIGAGPGA
jgi:hypothetical protein